VLGYTTVEMLEGMFKASKIENMRSYLYPREE